MAKEAKAAASNPDVPVREAPAKPPKSEQTRTLILETALRLFQERGYDRTTMRAIAQEAGVSVGNAYYYFAGKEHLVQGFYDRLGEEHAAAVVPVLEGDRDLAARIGGVLTAWLDVAEPYHPFAAQFFKNAADPQSPLSPFSEDSGPAREAAIAIQEQVLRGSSTKTDPDLAELLPHLMWLMQMGLVLFWVHDGSAGTERSRRLVERIAPIAARGIGLSRFRVLRPLVRQIHDVLEEFMPDALTRTAGGPPSKGRAAKAPDATPPPGAVREPGAEPEPGAVRDSGATPPKTP